MGIGETPVFGYTVDGLQNNETAVELTEAPVFTVKDSDGKVVSSFDVPGQYVIEVAGGLADNYLFNYFPAQLTVQSAANGVSTTPQVAPSATFDVYTLDGICVAKAVPEFSSLAKGVYVVNGRKVRVR